MRNRFRSLDTIPYAEAIMLPIRGEISMAPIITAVEPTFRPTEAIMMAHIIMHILVPVILPPESTRSRISSWEAVSSCSENISFIMDCSFSSFFIFMDDYLPAEGRFRSFRRFYHSYLL